MSASLSAEQKVIHFLNRTSFGPTREAVERINQLGFPAYLDEQLDPEKISDSLVEEKIAGLKTMRLNSGELFELYPPPKVAKERGMMAGEMREAPRFIILELQQARLLRAVYSQRQLYEIMVDFWSNHFNIFAAKGADRWLTTSYDRDTIRPHALGRFRDLLLATAQSPAMLFYLDNWLSVSPNVAGRGCRPTRAAAASMKTTRRELMELHTLASTAVTRNRTCERWRAALPAGRLLGRAAKASFISSRACTTPARKWFSAIASRPAVAWKTVCKSSIFWRAILPRQVYRDQIGAAIRRRRSAARLSSTEPPKHFAGATATFRRCFRTIIDSPEFFSPEIYQAKVKKPLEFVASALRVTGAETKITHQLLRYLGRMGEPLFLAQPPTGYPDVGSSWISPDMLLTRMNFAADLVGNRFAGARVQPSALGDTQAFMRLIAPDALSPATRRALAETDERQAIALLLAAPEFQRR